VKLAICIPNPGVAHSNRAGAPLHDMSTFHIKFSNLLISLIFCLVRPSAPCPYKGRDLNGLRPFFFCGCGLVALCAGEKARKNVEV
jgi:hypothetical protein